MSREVERPPLRIRPGLSMGLAVFLLIVHALVLILIWMLPLSGTLRSLMTAAVLLGLVYGFADQVFHLLPWSVREAVWLPDGSWVLTLVSRRELGGRLLPSTYVSPSMVVIRFRCGRVRSCSLLLLPDNLRPELLRRLRARLRLAGGRALGKR